jgi:hypothetical protein
MERVLTESHALFVGFWQSFWFGCGGEPGNIDKGGKLDVCVLGRLG